MLDIKAIRLNKEEIEKNLSRRGPSISLDSILALDEEKRAKLQLVEDKKSFRNKVSKEIGKKKGQGEDVSEIMKEVALIGDDIAVIDSEIKVIEEQLNNELLTLPNLLDDTVPTGKCDEDNVEVRRAGEPTTFTFKPKEHYDIGTALDILDFERGVKVSGSRFVFMKGLGARLERALINFMIDTHTAKGYQEVWSPFLVTTQSLTQTGQLPKFAEDSFKIEGKDLYLIPTGEVPFTNLYAGEVLKEADLPLKVCGFTPCFRSEAGSAGRDTRGLIRLHQFSKVEMVQFVKPEDSMATLEEITQDAETILQQLELPYRVVTLCSGDVGFGSAKTYDIEVYLPGYGDYREISSCSLYTDFQSRRGKMRYKNEKGKNELIHTLNGSGLAVGRTTAAILENYQQEDGSVKIPKVLIPYMGTDCIK